MTCPVQPHHRYETCGFRERDFGALATLKREPCGAQATHKVGVEDSVPNVHNLTQYLCCEHLQRVMGRCP